MMSLGRNRLNIAQFGIIFSVDCFTTVSILLVWKANGFYARGSVIAFKIAPPSKGGGSHNFMHNKQYKFCKISDWICTVK